MMQSSRDTDPFWAICGQVVVCVRFVGAVAVPGEYVTIGGFEDFAFVLHRAFTFSWEQKVRLLDGFRVAEATTGLLVAEGRTRDEALEIAGGVLAKKGHKRVAAVVAATPKLWTGMECHYCDAKDSWGVLKFNGISLPKADRPIA